ncbi:MAG: hypothetical protein HDQ88_11840, partial [Clostridia bacterium]|nr:hypothetical protein [Clostridia bacterium]
MSYYTDFYIEIDHIENDDFSNRLTTTPTKGMIAMLRAHVPADIRKMTDYSFEGTTTWYD